ncbi:MAG: ABC transporter substrate-binding protein, partial [Lachnospiraceae bacterium]|nr:ABC transporter substrate-binding protein [Lachnospiraceae bacterium]
MKKFLAMLLAFTMVLSLAACSSSDSGSDTTQAAETSETEVAETDGSEAADAETTAATGDTIRIGFFAPVSAASAAADGQSAQQSAELAVKIINENGGINGATVELVSYDDGLDTTEAANIAEKLSTADNVTAVVSGSYSGPTKVAAPIFQDAGLVMVSAYAVHPDVVNAGDYIFSQSFSGAVQATAAASFAVNDLGDTKIAIVAVDLDFGKEQAAYFKEKAIELGAEIISEDYISSSDNDLTSVISKIKDSDADMIYMPVYYEHASEICRQVSLQGLDVDILGCEGADSWQLLETAGEYAEGLYITTNMNRDDENEATQTYIEKYREEYDMEPDMVGASVYDAFQVLFAAMEEVGTDSDAIRDYIAAMTDFDTVTGTLMYYTSAGTAVKPVQIQQVGEDLEFHSYSIIDDIEIIDGDNIEEVEY